MIFQSQFLRRKKKKKNSEQRYEAHNIHIRHI